MWQALKTLMTQGGPVMWPLAVISILGLSIALRETGRFVFFYITWDSKRMIEVLGEAAQGNLEKARALSKRSDPVSCWFYRCLTAAGNEYDSDISPHDLPALGMTSLSLLATIAAVAPLLGILGTVMGIIQSFSALGELSAIHDVSAGISQALISTAAGLIVAMCALLPHNILAVIYARWEHAITVWAHRLERALHNSGGVDERQI